MHAWVHSKNACWVLYNMNCEQFFIVAGSIAANLSGVISNTSPLSLTQGKSLLMHSEARVNIMAVYGTRDHWQRNSVTFIPQMIKTCSTDLLKQLSSILSTEWRSWPEPLNIIFRVRVFLWWVCTVEIFDRWDDQGQCGPEANKARQDSVLLGKTNTPYEPQLSCCGCTILSWEAVEPQPQVVDS